MAQFMLLMVGYAAQPQASDAETSAYNAKWMEYFGELARSGALRAGAPFAPNGKRVQHDTVGDLELDTVDIGGFLLIDVDTLDAAVEIAGRAPHVALGGTTIVRPCLAVPPSGGG